MRIAVDCRYVRTGRHDGISRFTAGVVGALAELTRGDDEVELTMIVSDLRQLDKLPDLPHLLVSDPTSPREPLVALQVAAARPDVVWSPMQTMGSWGRRHRLVLTLHDLIYYTNRTPPPEFALPLRLLWRLYHLAWWPQRLLLDRADAVVTVSRTTRDEMTRHRLTRRPVTVVSNAADPVADPRPRTEPEHRDLVYMGSFMPYKNVAALARALPLLDGHRLHLMSRVSERERASLTALAPAGSLVFHDGASDEEYRDVLLGATAVVTASRAEGFGIPLVEGMALGTPAVVSDIPIFREIGGDAALYFDPESPSSIAAAVRRLEGEWAARSAASVRQAARFSWAASAEVLLELLLATGRPPRRRSRRSLRG
ncbi:glycosyltransferase family 1 protein [Frigoribacterium sp. VKM Ac-2530]|uniref:glycosyltransferase family 4 protein n=1 Tax=Frigoribacterium sp. VKM Ac-2530 TaxID=2783822 RepID=UPI00188D93DD|nr:glycosyltransferase family 4 protein [Frigoribacterium sp. VKM Ac-2530]